MSNLYVVGDMAFFNRSKNKDAGKGYISNEELRNAYKRIYRYPENPTISQKVQNQKDKRTITKHQDRFDPYDVKAILGVGGERVRPQSVVLKGEESKTLPANKAFVKAKRTVERMDYWRPHEIKEQRYKIYKQLRSEGDMSWKSKLTDALQGYEPHNNELRNAYGRMVSGTSTPRQRRKDYKLLDDNRHKFEDLTDLDKALRTGYGVPVSGKVKPAKSLRLVGDEPSPLPSNVAVKIARENSKTYGTPLKDEYRKVRSELHPITSDMETILDGILKHKVT